MLAWGCRRSNPGGVWPLSPPPLLFRAGGVRTNIIQLRKQNAKHTGMQEKNKQRKKENEKRKVGSKAHNQAGKKIVLKASPYQQIFPFLLQSRDGDLATPSAIFFLLSSATISSAAAAAVDPPPGEQINENQTKLPGRGGCSNSGSTY